MKSFLYDCARSIVEHYSDQIGSLTVVFPSRRAERYFVIELDRMGVKTRPKFTTIDGVMKRFSQLEIEGNLALLTRLYDIYSKFHPGESFDEFYSFGKLLLADFDAVDKYMVNAAELYSIVSKTKEVEQRFQDDTHRLAYDFWHTFQQSKAERHKEQQFMRVWQSLYGIYSELRDQLATQGKAYSGMIYRSAAQNIESIGDTLQERYIFIGLNALSRSETMVLEKLHKAGVADFIWDYDSHWAADKIHDAGYFVEKNLSTLPMAEYFTSSRLESDSSPQIRIIQTPSDVLQCKIALNESDIPLDERSAIVLTDERLLEVLLYSLPENVVEPNVSIGLPIRSTQAYKLIEQLVALQKTAVNNSFSHRQVTTILNHPFIAQNEMAAQVDSDTKLFFVPEYFQPTEWLGSIFTPVKPSAFDRHSYIIDCMESVKSHCAEKISEIELFALSKIADAMDNLIHTIRTSSITISEKLYTTLLFETIGSLSIPFVGHSGKGLQITGILETRALDFENVIILSLTDDNFPSAQVPTSYIPQNLRMAYGLPSAAEHTAIWSYYFYRLLQRAKKVNLLYCNTTRDTTSGEQSRYLYQLSHNTRYKTETLSVKIPLEGKSRSNSDIIQIPKNTETSATISSRAISPSAINRYINCPLAFALGDIKAIQGEEAKIETGLSSADIGDVLHRVMQKLYKGRTTQADIRKLEKKEILAEVDLTLSEITAGRGGELSATDMIKAVALKKMVQNIVNYDAYGSGNFEIIEIEKQISATIGGVRIQGTADRIDRMEGGVIRIVDYKSGGDTNRCASIEELFEGNYKNRNKAIVQLLTYGAIWGANNSAPVTLALYVARAMGTNRSNKDQFDPTIVVGQSRLNPVAPDMMGEFTDRLKEKLSEMISTQGAFCQSSNAPDCCVYCPYRPVCLK